MRIVAAARPVCSATSLIASGFTLDRTYGAARRTYHPLPSLNHPAIAHAEIANPEPHTVMDRGGAVRSIQAANVDMRDDELEPLWEPMQLERLARSDWTYLSRVTLGLIRVVYTESERSVVFLARPFVLLRFTAPDYTFSPGRGMVRCNIQGGLLVGRRREGCLELDV